MSLILLLPNWRGGGRLATHHLPLLTGRGLRLDLNVTAPRRIRHLHRRLARCGFHDGVRNGRLILWGLDK